MQAQVYNGVRLIPACAGKTILGSPEGKNAGAHPRVCGENAVGVAREKRASGSSPRVRGKRVQVIHHTLVEGLIPACAGKTSTSAAALVCSAAHPRVCGENARCGLLALPALGLIPACAGKTRCCASWSTATRAHPRVCGENRIWRDNRLKVVGSSPRVRGKRAHDGIEVEAFRLIPACAGKTGCWLG